MIEKNKAEFELCNIDVWQKDNLGEGVTVAVLDSGDTPFDYMKTNVIVPIEDEDADTDHGTATIAVGYQIAPKAKIILLPFLFNNKDQECIDYIKKHADEIDLINVSASFSKWFAEKYFGQLKELNIPIICSSGNDSDKSKDGVNYPAKFNYTIAVGAYSENHNAVDSYSNGGKDLDCVAPSWIYYYNSKGKEVFFNGTSCAAPFVTFSLALYISWRKRNGLPKLSVEEIRKFIYENTLDLYDEGHDYKSGFGLFRLPEEVSVLMNNPEAIILHHSATDEGTFESIRNYHIEHNGWQDIGYHYLIEKDGSLHKGRDEKTPGAHCKEERMNYKSIGICLVGNFDNYKPNEKQLTTLNNLIKDIFNRYGKLPIYPHSKFATYKTCPGTQFPLDEIIANVFENKHWAEKHWESLNKKGIKIYEKRFDDNITRGEVFALLDRLTDKEV